MKLRYFVTVMLLVSVGMAGSIAFSVSYAADTTSPATASMSDGEVRKINKDTGKITIKHGPLKNLDMPAMTMVFQVKDRAMLDQVKEGDAVRFTAEKVGGQYTVTAIEPKAAQP